MSTFCWCVCVTVCIEDCAFISAEFRENCNSRIVIIIWDFVVSLSFAIFHIFLNICSYLTRSMKTKNYDSDSWMNIYVCVRICKRYDNLNVWSVVDDFDWFRLDKSISYGETIVNCLFFNFFFFTFFYTYWILTLFNFLHLCGDVLCFCKIF